ncbi:MAG: polysaccharide biosynthesis protein [Clostridia bacterium]|nr:polysaccharide biosynthesis protein [Clostridia bacterium]
MKIKEQNLTQGGAVLLLSVVVVKLIGALFKIPLSSDFALGDLGFGYFSAVYDLYIPIYTLALSGFPVAIARMIADFRSKNNGEGVEKVYSISFRVLLILGVMGAFVFFSLAIPLMLSKKDDTFYSFLAIAPSILFCCIASVYRGYFEGCKNMVPTAVSNIIEALGKLCLGLGGAFITMRLTRNSALSAAAALFGITLGTISSCLYLRVSFKKNGQDVILKNSVMDKHLARDLIRLLIPIGIASLSVGLTAFIDSITLRAQLEGIIKENSANAKLLLEGTLYSNVPNGEIPTILYGIKGKAHTLFNLVSTLTMAFGVSAVPLITQYFENKDTEYLIKNTNLCLKLSSVLCMPAALGFMALSGGITELLYGNKSSGLGGDLLWIYGIAALFAGLSVPTTSLLQAASKQKTALVNIVWGTAAKLTFNLVLIPIPNMNVKGAVWSTVICFVVIFALNMIALVKAMGFVPDIFAVFVKPILSASICGLTAFFVSKSVNSSIGVVVAIVLAAVVYLTFLWFLRVFDKIELLEIVKK